MTDTMTQRWGLCLDCDHCAPLGLFVEQPNMFREGEPDRLCPKCGSSSLTVEDVAPVRSGLAGGEALRDAILMTHEEQRRHILDFVQTELVALARKRETREVDADDAMEAVDRLYEMFPSLAKHDRRFVGALWRRPGWAKTGAYRNSRIATRHARPIPVWRWEG